MKFRGKAAIIMLLAAGVALAGCSEAVEVTITTGGIRAVVVDEAIRPIEGASVEVMSTDKKTTTADDGTFAVSGLDAGTYIVKVSHPLYGTTQQVADVVAGEAEPKALKFQLIRTILEEPYLETLSFDGFIVCSQDFNALLFSEECGEGVGMPCESPVSGCERVGGQGQNNVQFDFFVSSDAPKSMVVELAWDPTIGAATTGALWTTVSTDFACDPSCDGNDVMNHEPFGNCATNPSYIRDDDGWKKMKLNTTTKISTFTWACGKGGTVPYDLQLNQKFQEFVTISYYLPLPEGWSFVNESPYPF